MGIKVFSDVAGLSSAPFLVDQIGGPVGDVQQASVTVMAAGVPLVFAADRDARFFYFIDPSGNILVWDANAPTTPPSVMVTQATIGTTLRFLDISFDNATLFATASDNKVYTILTAAPHTVALLAGSGAAATTSGTGAAAAFNNPFGLCLDPNNGQILYVWCKDSGGISQIVIATGVVTQVFQGFDGDESSQIQVSKDYRVYLAPAGGQAVKWKSMFGGVSGQYVAHVGEYVTNLAIDDAEPGVSNVYFMITTFTGIKRINLAAANSPEDIAPTANIGPDNIAVPNTACFRQSSYYTVDGSGNLLKVQN